MNMAVSVHMCVYSNAQGMQLVTDADDDVKAPVQYTPANGNYIDLHEA